MSELKKLPLYETHVKSGAKFTPFAGWNMPVSYGSSLNEHLSVRNSVVYLMSLMRVKLKFLGLKPRNS